MKGEPEKEAGYSLDLERSMQMLKMSRKGFLFSRREGAGMREGELQKLLTNVEHVQREMNTLKGNLDQIEEKENSLHMRPGDETGVAILDRKTERARKKMRFLYCRDDPVCCSGNYSACGSYCVYGQCCS